MQLVGQICTHCRERVTRDADGRFCPRCGSAVHNACAERARAASPSGSCRACGSPAAVKERAPEALRSAAPARGYYTILLGVALMIGGILAPMCLSGLAGNTQFAVASGALFGGVVLVVVGFLQSTRR